MAQTNEKTSETIVISGGTGLIGRHLVPQLSACGYRVILLSRKSAPSSDPGHIHWDPEHNIIDPARLESADYIIHLAGEPIAGKRWTRRQKEKIRNSRLQGTTLLLESIRWCVNKPRAFISASAVGYYGAASTSHLFSESDPPARDFLADVCREWEDAANEVEKLGVRTVKIRTGVVLSNTGGALEKMARPVRLGLGAILGKGDQHIPWVHIRDLCSIYVKAVKDVEMRGAYNAVAPQHVTNKEFMLSLARVLEKPIWLPALPASLLKLRFGEQANVLLKGSRISSEKITAAAYSFQFPTLEEALRDLLHKAR